MDPRRYLYYLCVISVIVILIAASVAHNAGVEYEFMLEVVWASAFILFLVGTFIVGYFCDSGLGSVTGIIMMNIFAVSALVKSKITMDRLWGSALVCLGVAVTVFLFMRWVVKREGRKIDVPVNRILLCMLAQGLAIGAGFHFINEPAAGAVQISVILVVVMREILYPPSTK